MSLISDRTVMPDIMPTRIDPTNVRYIKLGAGGGWEAASLDGDRIDFGFVTDDHARAAAGDWDGVKAAYLTAGLSAGTASGYVREIRDFYTLGTDTLWITFARGFLWWAFAEPEVVYRGDETRAEGSRYRRTIGPWRKTDVQGKPLAMHGLSTLLTQLAGYRRTICGVGASDYLPRRINAEEEPAVAATRAARETLIASMADLIRQLHWAEFELMVDLAFARTGWRRVSVLGGTMKDIDLLLEQPFTGERASVQVKSSADQAVLSGCLAAFEASPLASRFFFICHS
ncbi:MAG: restriction endonuclease, partial [Sphingobium sp.]